jgi:hypothetical protein
MTLEVLICSSTKNESSPFQARPQNCEKQLLATSFFFVSVRMEQLPLDGFSRNLMFEYFSKICRETSSFIKIGQE